MQQFDGELPDREIGEVCADDQAKLEALQQVGEAVRTHLELAADDVEARLDHMWSSIERSIRANGETPAAEAQQAAAERTAPARAADPGFWAKLSGWFDGYRGHLLTAAAAAGATALIVLAARPSGPAVSPTEYVHVPGPAQTSPVAMPNDPPLTAEPPVVERLDVAQGAGTILTIPGDDGENPTTVIWVTPDDMEGPI
jgi:hypothetical protein